MAENLQELVPWIGSPEVAGLFKKIHAIAAYELPVESKVPFRQFHSWVTEDPLTPGLQRIKPADPHQRKHYNDFTNSILGHTQNALAAVHYHREELLIRNEKLKELATEADKIREIYARNATIAGGNTLLLDIHYQGFILAVRRCLDYFTRGLDSYFKQRFDSFHQYIDHVDSRHPKDVSAELSLVIKRWHSSLSHFFSEDGFSSPRDRIAHREFVSAGVLNLTPHGVFVCGGGEDLKGPPNEDRELAHVINCHVASLENYIRECLAALENADRKWRG